MTSMKVGGGKQQVEVEQTGVADDKKRALPRSSDGDCVSKWKVFAVYVD